MARAHAYSVLNKLSGIAESAITISTGSTTNRGRLVDARQDRQWDSGTVSAAALINIDMDAGSAIPLHGVALLNWATNTSTAVLVQVTGADNSAFSTNPVVGQQVILRTTNGVGFISSNGTAVTKRWWRVAVQLQGSTTQLKVGELFAFEHTTLSRFEVYGRGKGHTFKTTAGESDVGRLFGHYLSGPHAVKRLVWEDLTGTQKDELVTMHVAAKGNAKDVLWLQSVDYASAATITASQECYLGRFLERDFQPDETDLDLWNNASLTLREQAKGVGQ